MSADSIDFRELARFVVVGVIATCGNLSAVYFSRLVLPYEVALLVGLLTGFTLSFLLSKIFAFKSRDWQKTQGELGRFLIVYATGALCYWTVSMVLSETIFRQLFNTPAAQMLGAFFGSSTMTFTSYFGHRFFTYKTFRNTSSYQLN